MRQANNRSTRWVLVSFLLAISLLLLTWESTPPTTGVLSVYSRFALRSSLFALRSSEVEFDQQPGTRRSDGALAADGGRNDECVGCEKRVRLVGAVFVARPMYPA